MTMFESKGNPPARTRRHDPERRDRIIDACLEVIAEVGVAGTTHRKVAAAADVPLGSMTYHFTDMEELLHVSFSRFADSVADGFEIRMASATNLEDAKAAVVGIITEDVFANQRDLVLTHELYTLAARDPQYRAITNIWMARSRRALRIRFQPTVARALDALIEGMTIHRALDTEPPQSRTEVSRVVDLLATLEEAPTQA